MQFLKIILFAYSFIYLFGCASSSLLRVGFLQLQWAGTTLDRGARPSHRCGFSCHAGQAPGAQASVVVAGELSRCRLQALEYGLGSWGSLT